MTEPVTQQQETVTKQKNPLRIEQGKKLVEYNCHKKEELKRLNEQITKQDGIEHKPNPIAYRGGGGFLSHTKIVLAATLKPLKLWLPNFVTSCFYLFATI